MVKVKETDICSAVDEGIDTFISVFKKAIYKEIEGELNAQSMPLLNSDQITLLAYLILRDEVMDGGFVQLIHNGYGGFIYRNPFAKAIKEWGITRLGQLISRSHSLYMKYHKEIEIDCTDEEFMAFYEKYPDFDDFDDIFIEEEEEFTRLVAYYIDSNIENFAEIVS